jgi:hypothetical protein
MLRGTYPHLLCSLVAHIRNEMCRFLSVIFSFDGDRPFGLSPLYLFCFQRGYFMSYRAGCVMTLLCKVTSLVCFKLPFFRHQWITDQIFDLIGKHDFICVVGNEIDKRIEGRRAAIVGHNAWY